MKEENRMKAKEQVQQEVQSAIDEMEQTATGQAAPDEAANGADTAQETTTEETVVDETAAALDKLREELKAKEDEATETKNRLLRLQADFDNFRRRKNEEQEQLSQFVTAKVAREFLKVLDNFERAETSLEQSTDGEALKIGMEKIHKQFEAALAALNIEEIKSQGETFDPQVHEAVMQGENPEAPEDSIDMVLEKGYKIGDNVIRHSKVRVVRNG